jgi:hypothetical protein
MEEGMIKYLKEFIYVPMSFSLSNACFTWSPSLWGDQVQAEVRLQLRFAVSLMVLKSSNRLFNTA